MFKNESNEFRQPVSVDFAPEGQLCEWCGKPAVRQLTAIGGKYHNDGGFFCLDCGQAFVRAVAESLTRTITAETSIESSPVP